MFQKTPKEDKVLAAAAGVYVVVALVGAASAIHADLPAEFMGHVPGTTVIQDFLWGWGTGISPPLTLLLVVVAVAVLLLKGGRHVVLWRWLLGAGGVLFAIGQLGEPHTYEIIGGPLAGLPYILVVPAMVVAPLAMAMFGIHAGLAGRRKSHRR